MAKSNKKVDNTSTSNYEMVIATREDKEEKPAGARHVLTDFWFAPGYKAPLLAGTTFVECNDGWFSVYSLEGNKMCYRVSPKVVETVFGAELVANI